MFGLERIDAGAQAKPINQIVTPRYLSGRLQPLGVEGRQFPEDEARYTG